MEDNIEKEILRHIRVIPDFPEKGISFKDITPLLKNPVAFRKSIDALKSVCKDIDFDIIVAPEARGFIVGSALAYAMGKGFAPVRKKENCRGRPLRVSTSWNMEQTLWRFTKMLSITGKKS